MSNMFPAPKDKGECPACRQLERAQGRCSENCDCRKYYWVYPFSCDNCGLGLVHMTYIDGPPLRGHTWTCDSCDTPTGYQYIPTCPSTFSMCPDCPRD